MHHTFLHHSAAGIGDGLDHDECRLIYLVDDFPDFGNFQTCHHAIQDVLLSI